uniref:Orcokinin 1 n=1 Tax=Scylla paramamosain TaxID=85552 RepID=A0A0S2YR65_SCYPA|nr:orcokinin 1 [Scylla paramamosain]
MTRDVFCTALLLALCVMASEGAIKDAPAHANNHPDAGYPSDGSSAKRFDAFTTGFGHSKRNFDEIDRSSFGFAKRNFDEIDRSSFGFVKRMLTPRDLANLYKRNFDEIDRSGFGFVRRNAE